ncbi:MAG: hypothetical protein IPH26_18695 [Sterolibacteriaceae bacterium]|uniref:Polysaccharide biosynthesis protein n=1 Tax=Candidatus Methylophosphatis roskildensis TaxID=2899263 RepID=A0A9D7E652_9PROT|nr:hypothetical protein [Candidatus Methylophosphatis roskildensis]MBK7237460.1 hypothetical protein [Sterolibacteriaceae bacterium]
MDNRYSEAAVKRSIVRYSGGRLLNAAVAFLIFVWIARELPERQYAIYIAAFALLELGLVLSGFGMEWVTAVFIPQARLKMSGQSFEKFVWHSAAIQAGMFLLGGCILYLLAPFTSEWFRLGEGGAAFKIYAMVMFIEGMSRVFRDQLLSCLFLQGAAQISQMVRNFAMLGFAFWIFRLDEGRTAQGLAFAEMLASAGSLAVAGWFLYRHLVGQRAAAAREPGWQLPPWFHMLRAGRNAWLSNIANLSWGGQAVVLMASRVVGAEATAALGFARNLSEQVRKYMPMEFLLAIVRTVLVARFAVDGDRQRLSVRAGLMYKANLLFLLPVVALSVARGDELCALISGGRYASAHWLLVGWLGVLVLWSHHRVTDLVAHTLGRSSHTVYASGWLVVTPAALLLVIPFREWGMVFGLLAIAEASYSVIVLRRMASPEWSYRPHWSGLSWLAGLASISVLILETLPLPPGLPGLALAACVAVLTLWGGAFIVRIWSDSEIVLMPPRCGKLMRMGGGT